MLDSPQSQESIHQNLSKLDSPQSQENITKS